MSGNDSVDKIIEVYEEPLRSALTENSVRALQPTNIKVALKPHQLAMIHAMDEKERACVNGFTMNSETNYSQFAILGDKVGSGKTITMLGYISQRKANQVPTVFSGINACSKTSFWSQRPVHVNECSGNTLIIVPHTLFHQWKHAIQKQTTLSYNEVKTLKAFEKPDFLQQIKQSDITLMSNTIIKQFMSLSERQSMQWSRVVFDEVDSIHFTSTVPMPSANFYWLITATWPNMLFHGLYMYISRVYLERRLEQGMAAELLSLLEQGHLTNGNNYYSRYDIRSANFFAQFLTKHPNRGAVILRTNPIFMDQSWKSPEINEQRIMCETPLSHRLVANYVSSEIQELLHGGDVKGALERLGITNTSQSSLVSALCEGKEKELEKQEKTLVFKESLEYSSQQAKDIAIHALKAKIGSLKDQINSLKERILHVKDEICAVCFEEPNTPTVVLCCSRLFCGSCIIKSIQANPHCPLCRANLSYEQIKHISGEDPVVATPVNTIEQRPKKKVALLNVIKHMPQGKFLVFNRYDNPFLEIEGALNELNIKVASVRGNKDHVSSILRNFEKGTTQVLLMNSMEAGAGMDLKSATHIVLMHAMRKEEEQQIIGRAMRLGRTEPLTLIRLLHDSET
jgi:SNF2 family DNA or RNA helicase